MRVRQPGDYSSITAEIASLEAQAAELVEQERFLQAELHSALTQDEAHFEEGEARRRRRELAVVTERRDLLAARIAAKRSKLPSAEAVAAAQADAEAAASRLQDATGSLRAAWSRYTEALDAAESAAGEVRATRADVRGLRIRLEDLVARFGLAVRVPEPPDEPGAKAAWLVGTLLAQTALGEPDDVVVRDLAAARRQRAS